MSQLIREGIVMRCANGGTPSSAAVRTALGKLAEASALLDGTAAAPAGSPPSQAFAPGSWDEFLDGGEPR